MPVAIPRGGLGTKAVFEVYKWERESPSHPVGLELLITNLRLRLDSEESPSHTVGLEQDAMNDFEVRMSLKADVSIPHGGLGT